MRKLALIFFIVFSITYTSAWFIIANITETKIHQKIEDLKSDGIIKSYSGNIDITGYPFKFMINIDYPNIHFTPKDHLGSYNLLYDGDVKIILGLFSNSVKLKTNGNMHLKGYINKYNFHIISSGDDTNFHIKLYDFLLSPRLIKNIIKSSDSIEEIFFGVIKSMHFSGHNLKLINKINNALIFNIEETDTTINTKYSNKYKIGYEEKNVNAEFGREFTLLWNNIYSIPKVKKILSEIPYNVQNYFKAFKLHELGVINYDAKINLVIDDTRNTDLYIDKFILKDDIEDININGKVKLYNNNTTVDINSKMHFNDRWYNIMQSYIRSADFTKFDVSFFKGSNNKSIISSVILPINGFINDLLLNNSANARASYVPRLHEMGTIETKIDANYKRSENKDFELELNDFTLKTPKFELKSEGDFYNRNNIDVYNLEINLTNYPTIVDISTRYLNRIAEAANFNFLISGKELTISEKTATRIKRLIHAISSDPEESTKNAKIVAKKGKADKYPSVGKYSSKEFKKVWGEFKSRLLMEKIETTVNDYLNNKVIKNKLTQNAADTISSVLGNLFGKNEQQEN